MKEEVTPALLEARERLAAEQEEKWKQLLSSVSNTEDPRHLLTEEVKSFYRAETSKENRALLYGDLRKIAVANRFAKSFDTTFQAFKRSVDAEERAALSWGSKSNLDNYVSIETVKAALEELEITVRYNLLTKDVDISGLPPCYSKDNAVDILPVYLSDYMRSNDFSGVTRPNIDGCLNCIADANRYNPLLDYLSAGAWDGKDRLPEIYRILGVESPRHQSYIKKWFIQCVALGLRKDDDSERPFGAEGVLVLQGKQGLAKTSFFRIMSPFPRWFVEGAIIDMRDKDSQLKVLRTLIAELGELDGTLKKEQTSLKAFVTSAEDRIRKPFGRVETRSVRRTSFCGTVNPKDYLKDETGSRRWWTVPITHVDKKTLFSLKRSFVNQFWFQIYQLYLEDPNGFRLTDAESRALQTENQAFEQPMKYEIELTELLDFTIPFEHWEWWKTGELAKRISDRADPGQVGRALKRVMARCGYDTTSHSLSKVNQGYPLSKIPLYHDEGYQQFYGDAGEANDEIL